MKIARGTMNDDLERKNAAKRISHRRLFDAGNPGIGNYDRIHIERLAVLFQKIAKIIAADFFLAFDQHRDVAGKLGVRLEIRFERAEMRKVLTFVVARASAVEIFPFEPR